jgi:dolichol-phosphate mannosyltransferase
MPDYEPEVIRNAYDMAVGGNDLVSVSAEQSTPFLSKCFYKVLAKYIPETGELQTDSFCILSRRLINRVSNMNRTVFFRKVLYNSSGLRTKRIIYSTQLRYNVGKEKSTRYKLQLGMDSIIAYTNFAFELSVSLTIFMMALVLIMMIYALIVKCTASPVPGWTSIILFVSFCFMGLFAILSIIIKYLQLAVGLLIKQKDYNFESIEKVTRQ